MRHTLGSILLFIIGLGILGGIARFIYQAAGPAGEYQAVLLTSGDVYFAKVEGGMFGFGGYLTLRDIYYPQVPETQAGVQPEVRLIKFGNEIHGPQDEIKVNRDHVIMVQPLRMDSQVLQTIATYKEGQQ
jgi:hypothetical protein